MKRKLFIIFLALFITGFAAAQIGPGRTVYVAVKNVTLKSSTGLLATTVATLNYGDEVTVKQTDGKYVEVTTPDSSFTGWTVSANFTTKKVIAGSAASTSAKEFAMAGKGFSQETENSYSSQKQLNFDDVDKIELITADEPALMRFIEEGRLSPGK
jgi:uncharacterized protein YgiM (DUF1202 family)